MTQNEAYVDTEVGLHAIFMNVLNPLIVRVGISMKFFSAPEWFGNPAWKCSTRAGAFVREVGAGRAVTIASDSVVAVVNSCHGW